MKPNTKLSNFLKEYRSERNLSISALSKMTGVSRPYLSQIEDGKIPTRKTLEKMAKKMWEDDFQRMMNGSTLIELAGYKLVPDEGEPGYDEFLKEQKLYEEIQNYETIIRYLEEDIKNLKATIDLQNVFNEDIKIKFGDVELEKDGVNAIRFLLKGIHASKKEE